MGDLSSRRGQILGTEPDGRQVKIKALVPEAELDRYATTLHSITHGRGTYRAKFHVYQEVPPDAAQKVAEVRKKELEEAEARGGGPCCAPGSLSTTLSVGVPHRRTAP